MSRLLLAVSIALMGFSWMGRSVSAHTPYYEEITEACQYWGCSPDYLEAVMLCEDPTLDPSAVGPNGELGIFQVDPRYWGVMSSSEEIWFAAQHLTAGDIYWACS